MPDFKEVYEMFDKPVYMVGGSVRDEIMGRIPNDFDFCTPATPDEIEQAIRNAKRKPYLVGKRYGTIQCKVNGHKIEITTFRTEKYEKNNRKPKVEFVDNITHDLSRRDFTINAIAKRSSGKIVDPFEGRKDIKDEIIRCVGKPVDRFREDPLRMLRACRFSAQLGFSIEEETLKAMYSKPHRILHVSKERWMDEMDKLLMSDNPELGLSYLWDTGLMNYIIPQLGIQRGYDQNNIHHNFTLDKHTTFTVMYSAREINTRWGALLHDVGKPFVRLDREYLETDAWSGWSYPKTKSTYAKHEFLGADIVEQIARHLKWSNERRKIVKDLVLNHMKEDSPLFHADRKAH